MRLDHITPGLDGVGEAFRRDAKFCETVKTLGQRYLEQGGESLIHGDLFPGSLLRSGLGELRVIDPEFSFCGDPEFDIGVFYAHFAFVSKGRYVLVVVGGCSLERRRT